MDRRLQILLPLLYLLLSQSSQTILLAAIGWAITNGLIDISTVPGRVAWALQRPGDFFKFFGTRTELGTFFLFSMDSSFALFFRLRLPSSGGVFPATAGIRANHGPTNHGPTNHGPTNMGVGGQIGFGRRITVE